MKPVGDGGAVPRPGPRATGRSTRRSTKDAVYLLTNEARAAAEADAAELPEPRQLRHLGVEARPLPAATRPRRRGAYVLTETAADKLLVEDRIVRGVRSGDKGRGKDGEELGNFEPGSDVVAKATVLAEGTLGHLTGAALDYFDLHGDEPAALGARRQGGLGGQGAARPRHPHDGLAAAQARQVERVRRQLHLPDGRGQGLHRARRRPRHHRRDLLLPRRASSSSRPTPSSRRSSTAASGSPGAPRRSRRAATGRCRGASRCPAW